MMKKMTYELQKMSGWMCWHKVETFNSQNSAEKAACKLYDKEGGDYRIIELVDGEWNSRTGRRIELLGYQLEKEECACCGKEVRHMDLCMTRDCYGIPFRWVCRDCYDRVMYKGYDGELYSELDECVDEYY